MPLDPEVVRQYLNSIVPADMQIEDLKKGLIDNSVKNPTEGTPVTNEQFSKFIKAGEGEGDPVMRQLMQNLILGAAGAADQSSISSEQSSLSSDNIPMYSTFAGNPPSPASESTVPPPQDTSSTESQDRAKYLVAGGTYPSFTPTNVKEKPSVSDVVAKINEGARLRGSNTVATLDENGRVVITSSGAGTTEAGKSVASNLTSMRETISNETDPEKKLNALIDYKGSVETQIANIHGEANKFAITETGVDQYEKLLEQSIAADRASPYYAAHLGADSTRTKEIRDQLATARQQANILTTKLVSENPELHKLIGESQLFINKEASAAQSQRLKLDAAEMKAQQQLELTSQNTMKVASILYPKDVANKTPEELAAFANRNLRNNKEAVAVVNTLESGKPTDLLRLTTEGNRVASDVTSSLQAEAMTGTNSGTDYEVAKQKASYDMAALANMSKPEKLPELIKRTSANEVVAKKTLGEIELEAAKMAPAAASKFKAEKAKELAVIALEEDKRRTFYNSVASWTPSSIDSIKNSTILGPIYDSMIKVKGTNEVSLEELATMITSKLQTKEEISAAKNELRMIATSAQDSQNKGIYGHVGSSIDIDNIINKAHIRSIFGMEWAAEQGILGAPSYFTQLGTKGAIR